MTRTETTQSSPKFLHNEENIMFVIECLYYAGLIFLGITIGWLALLTAGSWIHKEKVDRSKPPLNLGVIIPAYNEERQIYTTIQHIKTSDYPKELFQIIVIADNCSDRTADAARWAGAQVVERFDANNRGKGQAIDWFLQTFRSMYQHLDGLCFVDADVQPDRNMFRELSASLSHPEVKVVQGFNGVANPFESWRTALNTAAFNVFNHVRMAGNERLFGSSFLRGLGMAFETSLLQKYGWPAHSVIEDTEFTLMLSKDNIAVHYNPAAIITSEMASRRAQADQQRKRWEGGRYNLAVKVLPRLLKSILAGNVRYLHSFMDLFIPSLSLLVIVLLIWLGISLFLGQNHLYLFLLFLGVLTTYVVSGQLQRRASMKLWGYLVTAPLFILWKVLLYVKMICSHNSPTWIRTPRKAEMENHGGH